MEKRFVYADNAATTPVTPAVLEAMTPWLMENYGNPSSIYSIGRAARTAVEKARRQVAAALNAEPGEIYFTSCGTEADNWALKGSMRRWAAKGKKHLITAAFEHHAILHSAKALEKEGFEVTYLPVTPEGLVDPAELEKAIREDTALVSIMLANNEIGTVQPIAELAAIAHAHGAWFHTDAVQAVGHIPVDVKALGVDMLSLSGHKFHAPKGVGALYVKKGILPNIFMDGGAQEKGRRAGTENLASIVGLGEAITVATASLEENMARITAMRDRLIDSLLQLPRTTACPATLISRSRASRANRCCCGWIWPASALPPAPPAPAAHWIPVMSLWPSASSTRSPMAACAFPSRSSPPRRISIISLPRYRPLWRGCAPCPPAGKKSRICKGDCLCIAKKFWITSPIPAM